MTVQQFIEESRALYAKHFPESEIVAMHDTNLYRCITLACFLSRDKSECAYGIRQNDPLSLSFCIDANGCDLPVLSLTDEMSDDLALNIWHKVFTTKPIKAHYVYGSYVLNLRKVTGSPEKIIKTLNTYFERTKKALQEQLEAGNIHSDHEKLVRQKLIP